MKFAEWLAREGLTQTEAAARLGISTTHVSDLCRDRKQPSCDLLARIEVMTDRETTAVDFSSIESADK